MRAVLPLDRHPVLQQLLQLSHCQHAIRRFVPSAPVDAAAREPLQVLHETGDHRLERALDVRLVRRRLPAREDQRDPQSGTPVAERLRAEDLPIFRRDGLGEDIRLRQAIPVQALLVDHELPSPRRGHPLPLLPCTGRAKVVRGERPGKHAGKIRAVRRNRAHHGGQDGAGRDIVDDRQLRPVQPPVQQPRRDVDHGAVDLHVLTRPQRTVHAEGTTGLIRSDLSRFRRGVQLPCSRMRRDPPIERPVAGKLDIFTEVFLEHPLHPIDSATVSAGRSPHARGAELAQCGRDAKIQRRLAAVVATLVDEAEHALRTETLELPAHRLHRVHLDQPRHRDPDIFQKERRVLPGLHGRLHDRELLRPRFYDLPLLLRQPGN